jgi:hypothetical protein
VGQDGRVEDVLAQSHQDKGRGEGGEARPEKGDERPGREKPEPERQAELAAEPGIS